MSKIHPEIQKTELLSDHIKQIADFIIGEVTLRIVSHNMLNKCHNNPWPDNAWNVEENEEQYWSRLELLAQDYNKDIVKGANIIALQEAPRDATKFFKLMNLNSSWSYKSRNTGDTDEQALMVIYNSNIVEINEVLEVLEQRGNIYKLNVKGQKVNLINVHIPYGASFDEKLDKIKKDLAEVMKPTGSEIIIRFGDHNANSTRFKDLKVWQDTMPTSFAYDKEDKETGKKVFKFIDERDNKFGTKNFYKNYDGFAVSENFLSSNFSYKLYKSQIIIPKENTDFTVSEQPIIPILGETYDIV